MTIDSVGSIATPVHLVDLVLWTNEVGIHRFLNVAVLEEPEFEFCNLRTSSTRQDPNEPLTTTLLPSRSVYMEVEDPFAVIAGVDTW